MNLYSYNMPRILRGIELKLMLVLFPYDDQTFPCVGYVYIDACSVSECRKRHEMALIRSLAGHFYSFFPYGVYIVQGYSAVTVLFNNFYILKFAVPPNDRI